MKTNFQTLSLVASIMLLMTTLVVTGKVQAMWYESTGTSKIYKGDTDRARQEAIKDAVKEALLFAGASVTSAQQVTNGLLTQDMFEVRASGVVNEIEVVNEHIDEGKLFVTVRADIFAEERQCFSADYRKSLVVTKFKLDQPAHATVGGLHNIAGEVSDKLYNALKRDTAAIDTRAYIPMNIQFEARNLATGNESLRYYLDEVSQQTDVQYVLTGHIDDMSMGDKESSLFGSFTNERQRYFDMTMRLYDGYTGELVELFDFSAESIWEFNPRRQMDVTSRRFWQSDYGETISRQLQKAIAELDGYMQCLPAKARIIDVSDTHVRFNLGRDNGVREGDTLKLLHKATFTDKRGKIRPHYVISSYEVEVVKVYGQSAIATTPERQLLGNVQVGDMIRQTVF